MRCPDCNASNPESASFCGQCYAIFPKAAPEPTPGPTPDPVSERPGPAAAPARPAGQAVAGRFSAVDGELTWRCAVCDTTNDVTTFVCTVCGAKMDTESGTAAEATDWEAAKRAEALVPGLGHLRTGHNGMGASRMGIVLLWLIGSFTLAAGGVNGLLAAVPLILGMGVVWATGPSDLEAARHDRRPLLDPQRFMYLVIGATVGVIVAGGLVILL